MVTVLTVGAVLAVGMPAVPGHAQQAGTVVNADSAEAVSGSYIVEFEDGSRPDVAGEYGVQVRKSFDSALDGVLIEATAPQARRLAGDPAVQVVEQNTRVRMNSRKVTQSAPPSWGLDRIDQRYLPLDDSYTYPARAGAGVDVYMVDTGIDYDHPDLGGRARPGFDAFGGDGGDGNGHGTHMAGIVGGTEHGVAKRAELVSVKVVDAEGGGTVDGLLDGIEWITENASGPSVANFVIGLPPSDVLDDAVRRSISSGVTYSLEAGTVSDDVANASPAGLPEGITVGASDRHDRVADFSSYGQGLDLYAPGVDVTSAWLGGGTHTMSGTSVAAAHVSGVAALYLSQHRRASPNRVAKALERSAVDGTLTGVPTEETPNKLLQEAHWRR